MAMEALNVHEAKTHLSRLLERVERGEEIIIARNNVPIARLVPHRSIPREPGRLKGRLRISDDFDAPLPPEIQAAFDGR
jgi:prevent-host-death family protein